MKLIGIFLILTVISGCASTDYKKNLEQATNCSELPKNTGFVALKNDKKIDFDIGGKKSNCININGKTKSFYASFKVEESANFLLINANQNVVMSGSSYFMPVLYAVSDKGTLKEVNYIAEMKTSKLIPVRYYTYHYDLRHVSGTKFLVSTDASKVGDIISFEYVNSYDLVSQNSADMPLSPGGVINVTPITKLSPDNIL